MEELYAVTDLLYKGGSPMPSRDLTENEAIALAEGTKPHKPWCIVKNWIWVDLEVSLEAQEAIQKTGYSPVMMYAHYVINDSKGRFNRGDWVRSTPLLTFAEQCLFETRNTIYVLTGEGTRKNAKPSTLMKIF
ncbi:hypothetical protein EF096_20035 [Pseudomonas neustonica]|uniref:DUF6957 domain-containing protein n=1 Tax=Pseudomonas neustonica TaxID=2487346 RepID=A0ABX9XGP9_9PSED|nr:MULTISPECIES: hypothetical protein [Pseudomonas]ROZ79283.1 hypothetical protein EF099_20055 [Pseudomonas sp. SSM44]ROZ80210.1 hypothetical protein EF096_20035 [Pseudomonas neustonica]|tara:strand:+ start:1537 stop:1935 length:399 start_codon:yes stop_codon:yes gene_type:complete